METNITDILKEATNDLLTEEVLQQIELAFESAVDEKAAIHVEKALTEQDEEHAAKLETLLESIDNDHTKKLHRVVEAVTSNHTEKLKEVITKYEGALNEEANGFKADVVDNISNYLDLYLEAVKAKKAQHLVSELRNTLGVDMALAQESISEAVIDGKQQLDESASAINQLEEHNTQLTAELVKTRAHILLSEKTEGLADDKKTYIFKVLSGKSEKFINENFDYTLKLFDKTEEQRLEQYKKEAASSAQASEVDRVITESPEPSDEPVVNEQTEPYYMRELQKW